MSEQTLSYYCLARYVPDPIKAEAANFGVFVLTGGNAKFHCVSDWTRLRKFGGEQIDFLKEFAQSAKKIHDEQFVRHIATNWRNSIQFTEPRPSLMAPEELLIHAARTFLTETGPAELGYRRKLDLVRTMQQTIREALKFRLGLVANIYLKPQFVQHGKTGKHTFDLGVSNGHTYFLAQAISFEIADSREIEKQVDATSWAIKDLDRSGNMPAIGVVTLPPKEDSEIGEMYSDARKVFIDDLNAAVLDEQTLQPWAKKMAELVPVP